MKKFLIPTIAGLTLAVATITPVVLASQDSSQSVGLERPHGQEQKILKKKKELAGDLCYAAMEDGAYSAMDADTLSAYCIHVATHIMDAPYDHADE